MQGAGDHGSSQCSFCGKYEEQVKKVIPGPGVFICDECVSLCVEILVHEGIEPAY